LTPIVAKLKALDQAGRLGGPVNELAPGYVQMHVNRMLRSAQRAFEVVCYDFLGRLFDAQTARQKRCI
jgi:hypothetical protein